MADKTLDELISGIEESKENLAQAISEKGVDTTGMSLSEMSSAVDAINQGVQSSTITYQVSSSGTTIPTGTWSSSIPSVSAGQYLWTRVVLLYFSGDEATFYSISRNGLDSSCNLEDGEGTGSVQQVADGVADGFDFTGKNDNATTLDPELTGSLPYGAIGNFSSAFGGKSSAQGSRSMAVNNKTIAKGDESFAQGYCSVALGGSSFAGGVKTTAKGEASVSLGTSTQALADHSLAEGSETTASGKSSHAEGYQTTSSGEASHTEGSGTTASGVTSHAEGTGTIASGGTSHAEGARAEASGVASHAEGIDTVASGEAAHTEGTSSTATGDHSHAGGLASIAEGHVSFAHGEHVKTEASHQTAFGRYNANNLGNLFEIGNGTDESNRSNAFAVTADGRAKGDGIPVDDNDFVRLNELKPTVLNLTPYSWEADSTNGGYKYSITAKAHGKGEYPDVKTYVNDEETYDSPRVDSSGNITLFSNAAIAMRVVIKR